MILVPIKRAYATSYYSNFGPVLHRFRDTANHWLKMAYFAYPLLFSTPFPIFPLQFHGEVKRQETSHGATLW